MMKKFYSITTIFITILFSQVVRAQCNWTSIFYDSYEYTTVVPYIVPGATYHNVPFTNADASGGQVARTGSRGLYFNIVNGYLGLVYSQTFPDICVGQNYHFSFSTREANNSTNDLTFNVYDANNVLISTRNVINGNTWNDITMSDFTATTTSVRFEIVTNLAGTGGNDASFDDLRLSQCQPVPSNYNVTECLALNTVNLYQKITGTHLSNTGIWSGPTTLTNGYQGTFTVGNNSNGTYTYIIDGAAGCADSSAIMHVAFIQTPVINPIAAVASCGNYTLPVIAGTDLSGNQAYYTGPNGTGTRYPAGTAISTSQTLYAYDGAAGCSDQESFVITISQPGNAGADNAKSYCGPAGFVNLNLLLAPTATTGGIWTETTVPPSGNFNAAAGILNTNAIALGNYTFNYTIPANGACPADVAVITIGLGSFPPFSLGNDTTICQGSSLALNPGPGFTTYQWDNGSTNQTRFVTQAGTYSVTVGLVGDNIINNGDFENGNTGFTTSYVVGVSGSSGPLTNASTYAITTSPKLVHNDFSVCEDHTAAPGTQMMVVNGAGTPNTKVWCQDVSVQPNTDYQFSTWVSSALNNANVAQLQFSINASSIGNIFSPTSMGCNWQQFFQTWNSGLMTTAQICVVNQNTNTSGNDFMLDDISFAPICYATDEIVVTTVPSPVITVSPNDTICVGENASLTASSANTNLTYTWTPGPLNGQTVTVSPTASTVYSVIGKTPEGCVSNIVSTSVLVRPSPVLTLTGSQDTLCIGETVQLNVASNIAGTTYQWTPVAGTGATLSDSPVSNITYSVTGTSPIGCTSTQTYNVVVIPKLDVNITGTLSFCEGSATTLNVSGNQPTMTYVWTGGNTTTTQTVNDANVGWIYVTGNYWNCPPAKDSVLTVSLANPIVTVPDDFNVCPGEPVTATVSSNQPNSSFVWTPGNLTGSSNVLTSMNSMTYYVYATNGNCISAVDSFSVIMSGVCYLDVPNVFTPNNDGKNDFFQLIGFSGIKTLECVIFNRWGNTINTFDKANFMWDGKDKSGNEVLEGTYFYKITAVTAANEEINKSGFVQLVRK